MPKTAFPLTKHRSFQLGSGWEWRVIELVVGAADCRLLLALHQAKQEAFAMLAAVDGENSRVLATLENHASHPGWHIHAQCDGKPLMWGRRRSPDMRRIPANRRPHRRLPGLLSVNDVLQRAYQTFKLPRIGGPGGLL